MVILAGFIFYFLPLIGSYPFIRQREAKERAQIFAKILREDAIKETNKHRVIYRVIGIKIDFYGLKVRQETAHKRSPR